MNFPSVSNLADRASATARRFPFTMLAAFTAAYLLLTLIGIKFNDDEPYFFSLMNGLVVCSIGIPLFTALTLLAEVRNSAGIRKYLWHAVALLLLCWYYSSLPDGEYTRYELLRFMIYNFCAHLLAAFLPYIGRQEPEGFWAYNKSLFLQILTSGLYSAVLFGGLAVALLAIDNLFEADIDERNYARLWVIIASVFNTWFFLSGVPGDFKKLQDEHTYPRGLKIFTQYVLLPIITIYMAILYAYMGRIILSGIWPEGWVSWLVLCFSVAGILALLLIWPVRNDEGNAWMRIYAKGFYFALFPLVIMLFLSIRIRVLEYGITEGRYYVVLLAIWLACMAAYFLMSRNKSIKVIPLSLFIIGVLSVHGPWSAFSVSQSSQHNLLTHFLEKNKLLVNGKVVPAKDTINKEDHLEIIEKVEYLSDVHGYQSMQDLFTQDLDSVMVADSGSNRVNESGRILALMNLPVISRYGDVSTSSERNYYFGAVSGVPVKVSGFDYVINLYSQMNRENHGEVQTLEADGSKFEMTWNRNSGVLTITDADSTVQFDFQALARKIYDQQKGEYSRYNIPLNDLTMDQEGKEHRFRVLIRNINGVHKFDSGRFEVREVTCDLMIGSR